MSDSTNPTSADHDDPNARFDSIRQTSPYGAEYWSARDLYPLLGYDTWRRFETAIERAKIACANMGEEVADHFAGAVKGIQGGKGAQMDALLSQASARRGQLLRIPGVEEPSCPVTRARAISRLALSLRHGGTRMNGSPQATHPPYCSPHVIRRQHRRDEPLPVLVVPSLHRLTDSLIDNTACPISVRPCGMENGCACDA